MQRMYKTIVAVLQPETFNHGGLARVDIPADGLTSHSLQVQTQKLGLVNGPLSLIQKTLQTIYAPQTPGNIIRHMTHPLPLTPYLVQMLTQLRPKHCLMVNFLTMTFFHCFSQRQYNSCSLCQGNCH
jgi:hypothetical protein